MNSACKIQCVYVDDIVIEEKDEDEIEINNDNCEETKQKGIKTNEKAKKIRKEHKNKEELATKDTFRKDSEKEILNKARKNNFIRLVNAKMNQSKVSN